MADVAELLPPPAVDQSGNLTIWWVPTIADIAAPKAATEIGGASAFRVTYSFTSDGWGLTGSQTKDKDNRLTLKQPLESLGVTDASLTLKYVDSDAAGSAAVVLVEGLIGYFVERRSVPNSTLAAAAQKGRVIKVQLGKQIPGPVDGTGKFVITQEVALLSVIGAPATFAA